MKVLKQVGPFGKAQAFLEGFVYSATRSAMFMELLEEMDKLEKVISGDAPDEERKIAEMLHKQLEQQFILMITPVETRDKARTRKNI